MASDNAVDVDLALMYPDEAKRILANLVKNDPVVRERVKSQLSESRPGSAARRAPSPSSGARRSPARDSGADLLDGYGGTWDGAAHGGHGAGSTDKRRPATADSPSKRRRSLPTTTLSPGFRGVDPNRPRAPEFWRRSPSRPESAGRDRGTPRQEPDGNTSFMSPMSARLTENIQPFMERLPRTSPRVLAFRNGSDDVGVAVAAPTIDAMLDAATNKLALSRPARRLFLESGEEVVDVTQLDRDVKVYVSQGEPFRVLDGNPLPWTELGEGGHRFTPKKSIHNPTFSDIVKVPVKVQRNGTPAREIDDVNAVVKVAGTFNEKDEFDLFLQACTDKLHLTQPVRRIFTAGGNEIHSTRGLTRYQVVFASVGEAYYDPASSDAVPWRRTGDVGEFASDIRIAHCVMKRVYVLRNGEKQVKQTVPAQVLVPYKPTHKKEEEFQILLEQCTRRLNLNAGARRLFKRDGEEVLAVAQVDKDDLLYVSCGEEFIDPTEPVLKRRPTVHPPLGGHIKDRQLAHCRYTRLLAYQNGADPKRYKEISVVAPPVATLKVEEAMGQLLDNCSNRLGLTKGARRIFLEDGTEVTKENYSTLERDTRIWVSLGEDYRLPGSLVLPHTRPMDTETLSRLAGSPAAMRLLAFRNGWTEEGCKVISGKTIEQLLDNATEMLTLHQAARYLFTADGEMITDLRTVNRGDVVFVSVGEVFKPQEDVDTLTPGHRSPSKPPAGVATQ